MSAGGGGPQGPLAGVRVIDLAGPPAVFAARQLAELGADVIRVEPPGGDVVRRRPPFLDREPGTERSLHHLRFNAGKRSVVLDLEGEPGRAALRSLAGTADVVLETDVPGAMDGRGLGFEALRTANPGLIYATVTPYGQRSARRTAPGTDLTAVASGGLMYLNGFPEDPPMRPGAEQGHHMGSLVATAGILLALAARSRDPAGGGCRVDVSQQEAVAMTTLQTANANLLTWLGDVPRRQGMVAAGGRRSIYPCRDGRWVSFTVPLSAPALWDAFVGWMAEEGLDGPFADPAWRDDAFRALHPDVTAAAIAELCARHDRASVFADGQRRRMLVMPVNTAADLVACEHLGARSFFRTVEHPHLGRALTDAGPPHRFSRTPSGTSRPAPQLGEHDREVLGPSTPTPRAPTPTSATGAPPPGAAAAPRRDPSRLLAGLRVADFCWLIAGPALTRVLAEHGADVVKIESSRRLDTIRSVGVQPPERAGIDANGVFNDCNGGKRSLRLDLGVPRGIALAEELVRRSDIVTSNFTGERMDRWGLGYEQLRRLRPDVIVLSMPAMGATGPYRNHGSYGNGLVAYSGMNEHMGPAARPPIGTGPLYSDFSAPYVAVAALMAALVHRERTGEGQFIELSQAEATINLLGTDVLEWTANGDLAPRMANRARDMAPHGAFRCAGDDRWCALAVRDDDDWRRLTAVLGRPDLAADARLATLEGRQAAEDEIDAAIAAFTAERDAWDVAVALQAAGVPASVVEDLADVVGRDPDLPGHHIVPVERDGLVFHMHAQPLRIDGRTAPPRPAPRFGQHDEEVLRGLLGVPEDELARLVADGVVA